MTAVVLQPSYIPWRGYFHQIQKADVFVFYDDVQYDRHGWRNRNRIKTPAGTKWLTIPLRSTGAAPAESAICDMQTAIETDWPRKHFESLRHNYARAQFFRRYLPLLEEWYGKTSPSLADFTIETTIALAGELGILHTRFVRSSTFGHGGAKTERLLAILRQVGAQHYVSGPAARDYLDVDLLQSAGISVEWMVYDYPEYPQLYPPYDPHVTILDLLFNVGPDARHFIWERHGTKTVQC